MYIQSRVIEMREMKYLKSMFVIIIVFNLLIFIALLPLKVTAQSTDETRVYVSPAEYTAIRLGEIFQIDVKIYHGFNITGYEFRLKFNNTLLHCLNVTYGDFFPLPPRSVQSFNIDNEQGEVEVSATLSLSENPKSGNAILATIVFNATYAVPYGEQREGCELLLEYVYLYQNWSSTPITPTLENGYYYTPWETPTLQLSLNMKKDEYYFEEEIIIQGDLYADSVPVSDALIGLEIYNPQGYPIVSRTFTTGAIPPPANIIEILSVTPCDLNGAPTYTFRKKTFAYFYVVLENKVDENKYVVLTLNIFDSRNATLGVIRWEGIISGNSQSEVFLSFPVEEEASTGTATVYANAFTQTIKDGGVPYCKGKSANFTIIDASGGGALPSNISISSTSGSGRGVVSGHYELIFEIPFLHPRGNYLLYVATKYFEAYANNSRYFNLSILGDVDNNGKVDLSDLVTVALAYGLKLGDPQWNPEADINKDGEVNLQDLVIVAIAYGREA